MHPFISSDTMRSIIDNADTRAIIIETYGVSYQITMDNVVSLLSLTAGREHPYESTGSH